MNEGMRYAAYELVNIPERSLVTIPAPGWEVVLASDYDALAQRLAAVEQELQAIRDTVGDEDFYLRQEIARLREQLRLANIDAANNEARANDLQQQLAAAQGVWSTKKPTEAGGYWVENKYETKVMQIARVGDGLVVGTYKKPLEECHGWRFAGPIPEPREAR